MNRYKTIYLSAPLAFSLASFGLAVEPIVTSDGPGSVAQQDNAHSTIRVTDGPMEYTAASRAGKKLNGSWVVETSGPGTGRLVVLSDGPSAKDLPKSKIIVSDGPSAPPTAKKSIVVSNGPSTKNHEELPDPERSTLAPALAVSHSAKTFLEPQIKKTVITVDQWSRPKAVNAFDVYTDKKYGDHFLPTGWVGDYGDVRFEEGSTDHPHSGNTCIQITYLARSSQGNGWAGMYWQTPANNWGDKTGGYDLSGKKSLTFWARGAQGHETIAEFRVGGIGGQNGDSDSANIGPIVLTNQWKQYTIHLAGLNLHHIIGGFSWSANREANPHGFTIYLDDIRYE